MYRHLHKSFWPVNTLIQLILTLLSLGKYQFPHSLLLRSLFSFLSFFIFVLYFFLFFFFFTPFSFILLFHPSASSVFSLIIISYFTPPLPHFTLSLSFFFLALFPPHQHLCQVTAALRVNTCRIFSTPWHLFLTFSIQIAINQSLLHQQQIA